MYHNCLKARDGDTRDGDNGVDGNTRKRGKHQPYNNLRSFLNPKGINMENSPLGEEEKERERQFCRSFDEEVEGVVDTGTTNKGIRQVLQRGASDANV